MQQHRNFQYCSARAKFRGRAPSGTALDLEDAPEPSRPCLGTAKDKPNDELPAIMAPAVTRSESMAGARGGREGVASMAPVSSYHPAPYPRHSGNHGGRDPGMQPGFFCFTGERLLALSRAAPVLLQDLLELLLLGVYICLKKVLESRKRSLRGGVPGAPPAPRGGLFLPQLGIWAVYP
ncbi:CMT1A duplicated region transcript 15 protein-like protein [Callithrix jacchus]